MWSYQTILNHSISRGLTSSSSLSQFAWSLQCNKTHTTCTWSPCKTALSKRCTVDIQNRPQRTHSKSNFTHNHQQFLLPRFNWAIWQTYRTDHAEKRLEFRPGKWTSEKLTPQTAPKQSISEIYNLWVPTHWACPGATGSNLAFPLSVPVTSISFLDLYSLFTDNKIPKGQK